MSEATYTAELRSSAATLAALLILTLVTVALARLELPAAPAVVLALAVASLKAALVGAFFMHLTAERAFVYWTLGLTGVVVAVLLILIVWSEIGRIVGAALGTAFDGGLP